jgi:exodeoxyribonuclease VII large subunit
MPPAMRFDFSSSSPGAKVYSVAQLNRRARGVLEAEIGAVWLEAEVSQATRARSGHLYFKLADPDGRAQIDAVMWAGQARRYGRRIDRGALLRCHGRVTVYENGGRYQLVVDRAEESGAGLRARKLAELRARLNAEGLFDPERKRALPSTPSCVGVVSSRDGAAFRDIVQVVSRRFPVRLLLAHARVQGTEAPRSIVAAIERISAVPELEVLIVGRGGGSAEDLDAFNDEAVVRAVAGHPVPVISAVGHEIDVALTDLAADRRAATPSEAAELAVPEREGLAQRLSDDLRALRAAAMQRVGAAGGRLAGLTASLRSSDPRVRLRSGMERLGVAREALARWPASRLGPERARIESLGEKLTSWPRIALPRMRGDLATATVALERWPGPASDRARARLGELAARLDALSPLASLERGYAVVRRRDDGSVVSSASEAPAGTAIEATLARGRLDCRVERAEIGGGPADRPKKG